MKIMLGSFTLVDTNPDLTEFERLQAALFHTEEVYEAACKKHLSHIGVSAQGEQQNIMLSHMAFNEQKRIRPQYEAMGAKLIAKGHQVTVLTMDAIRAMIKDKLSKAAIVGALLFVASNVWEPLKAKFRSEA